MPNRWIASARFDLAFFLGPPILAVALVLAIPALRAPGLPLWGWVLFVVGIDVAHVYASLYRTYFDPEEFARRRTRYLATPLLCWGAGAILYSLGAIVFWRAVAYLAVFHFVRQQYGFVMLYRNRAGERSPWDARIDKIAIYATMLYPLVFWHADPGRVFVWFTAGDFVRLPGWTATVGVALYSAALGLFALRQLQHAAAGRPLNWGKIGVVLSTAAVWYVGIVLLNSDFAFTVTNVVAHGVPYFALVWLYGRRKWGDGSWRQWIHKPGAAGVFVGALLALAYIEEGAWDLLVWKEHAAAFGGLTLSLEIPDPVLTLLVPLLILPQTTHYVLDAWIWKFGPSNPGMKTHLFGPTGPPALPAGTPASSPAVPAGASALPVAPSEAVSPRR